MTPQAFIARLNSTGAYLAPQHRLEAPQQLCDTGDILEGPIETRTGTGDSERFLTRCDSPQLGVQFFQELRRQAGMAELADAADSKSADPCGHGGSTPPPGTIA